MNAVSASPPKQPGGDGTSEPRQQLASQQQVSLDPILSLPVSLNHWLQLLLGTQARSAGQILAASSQPNRGSLFSAHHWSQPDPSPNAAKINRPPGFLTLPPVTGPLCTTLPHQLTWKHPGHLSDLPLLTLNSISLPFIYPGSAHRGRVPPARGSVRVQRELAGVLLKNHCSFFLEIALFLASWSHPACLALFLLL